VAVQRGFEEVRAALALREEKLLRESKQIQTTRGSSKSLGALTAHQKMSLEINLTT
jgi:hypothetical protein